MNLLAFDTATERMSVALQLGAEVISSDTPGGAKASAGLLPAVFALLAEGGIALAGLDAIAFGRGPGAFTGLRTACAVAQGLAFGAAKPVLPIDTLLAVAEDAGSGGDGRRVWALLDARMGEIYAAQYRFPGPDDRRKPGVAGWQVLDAPRLTSPEALNQHWRREPPEVLAGNALTVFAAALEAGGAVCHPAASPTARALLRLAGPLWAQGMAVDAALALPLYLREKVAQTTEEREAVRAAKAAAAVVATAEGGGR